MKYFKHCILPLLTLISVMCSCGPNDPEPTPTPDPTPKAPTAVTLSKTSVDAPAEGGTYDITVKSPFDPQVKDKPSWVTVSNAKVENYTYTVTVIVDAQSVGASAREATLTFEATGATSATLKISQAKGQEPEPPAPGYDGLASFFGLGWNLGNQFDAYYNGSWAGDKEGYPDETCWMPDPKDEYKATQATFDGLKNLGFTSVRIPVSWLKMIGDAPDYKINEEWLNRVYTVAQYAHTAGLKVIVNTHHDENHGTSNSYEWLDIKNAANNAELKNQITTKITAVWKQIATKFADCGDDWLLLEGFNELNDGKWGGSPDAEIQKQCAVLNEWNQAFVNAVRATGGNNATRWLGVPTYCASPSFTGSKYFTLPNDTAGKLAVAVHSYDPYDYTIGDAQYPEWGHTGTAGKKPAAGEEQTKQLYSKLYSDFVAKGIPVYMGEFGCSMRSKSDTHAWAFYKYYMEYVVKAAKTYCIPCFLWDNNGEGTGKEKHGYVHHGKGTPIGNSKEVIDVMKKAWFTESEGYTLETVYNSAPKF